MTLTIFLLMSLAPTVQARTDEPIPGYRLRNRVGAGGYGEVWAVDAPGGLVKAIKFVYGQMDEARAAREFKSLNLIKGVRHPFLLSLERIEVVDGQLLIVSELADASLKERFEQCLKGGEVGIPRAELLQHLSDAADALDYMHTQHGLQHLDVKPENLLLIGGRIKVADFGLVKDIQEVTSSLMGGLTPIYAPPEVFDARPSRRSDQYSLAIVYQEMLTGLLPFPGRTTAQLAAQHLTAKPRLNSLPAADQIVIERALSKDPEHRFGSCREMVEALIHIQGGAAPHVAPVSYENGAQVLRTTAMFEGPTPMELAAYTAATQPKPQEQEMLRRAESAVQATTHDLLGQYEAAEQVAQLAVIPAEIEQLLPPTSLVDMPPLDVELPAKVCRPTLFLGIGGLAGKSFQKLRSRLADCGAPSLLGQFRFLLLDTDARELSEASQGGQETALQPEETLALPIRKSADYRNASGKYLDWLSRRWLFNIPRSQQTEGIRPFGRLALVDHGETVMQRLRGAISQLIAVAESTSSGTKPRVMILGSSSGGASSGMVMDIAFAVRQILEEQKSPGSVDLLLLHATSRQPAAQELAAVNSYSLLTELNHVLKASGSYPGDFSCGLNARPASQPAINNLYLFHLGQELGNDQFLAACDRVAEYLFVDSATPAGVYLDACRSAEPRERRDEVTLRTFDLCQIGFSETLISRGVDSLCRAVALLWFGEPKARPTVSLSARIENISAEIPPCPNAAKEAELDLLASEQAKSLGLEVDSLVQRLYLLAAEEFGGNPDLAFQRIIRETPVSPNAPPPVEKWFAGSARFFGARGSDLEFGTKSPLQSALLKRMSPLVAPLGEKLREWLVALAEQPSARAFGAQWCAKWSRAHLKSVAEKAAETRAHIGGQLITLEQKLAVAAKTPPKAAAKGKDPVVPPDTLFQQHCQLRMYQLAAQVATEFVQGLATHVVQASDYLHDLGRDIKHLASQFSVSEQTPSRAIDAAALLQLQEEEERAAILVDQWFQQEVFAKAGFRAMLQGGKQRFELVAMLQKQARQVILESLRRVDLLGILQDMGKPGENGKSQLGTLVASAQPWLQQAGGERRLLCVVGQGNKQANRMCLTPAAFSDLIGNACFGQLSAVIPAATSEVVFCYEIGNVPLTHAAAEIIHHCPQHAQTASRLHTRADISWQELPL